MLLIYIDKQTNRLGYTINLIFKELLQVDYMVTTSREQFIALGGAKLSYCESKIYDEIHISNTNNLLFETNIYSLDIDYVFEDGIHKIFRNYGNDDSLGFDIFAATFYMVSRYEEYLPFIRDEHLRFNAKDSIAWHKKFLEKPVVNIWAEFLKKKLLEKYPDLQFATREFTFVNTIDVDQAYCYKHKGLYRTVGGFMRDILHRDFKKCLQRFKILCNLDEDPYNCFDYILQNVTKYKLHTIFFFLFGTHSKFDKNTSPYNRSFQLLVKNLSDYSQIGIHPSYYSIEYPQEITRQIKMMTSLIHKKVLASRFHYLRFSLPQSYNEMADNGITDEYSMGYSDCIGFRAGICTPYNFYDLDRDCETKLKVHPFAFMDVALKNGLSLTEDSSWERIKELIDEVKQVNGVFISLWHNESLSDYEQWQGWRMLFEKQIRYIENL